MSTKNILSVEVNAALTVQPLTDQVSKYHESRPATILKCITDSVYAIPEAAMPKQSSFHLVGNALVTMCDAVLKEYDEKQTTANTKTAIRNATNAELHRREAAICTAAIAAKAKAEHAAKANKTTAKRMESTAKKAAEAAAVEVEPSLNKAGKRGVAVARLKSSNIKVRQSTANKAGKTRSAKPTKLEEAKAAETRKAIKELFLQSVDNALDIIGLGEAAKAEDILVAFTALANNSKSVIEYLPADMRTL